MPTGRAYGLFIFTNCILQQQVKIKVAAIHESSSILLEDKWLLKVPLNQCCVARKIRGCHYKLLPNNLHKSDDGPVSTGSKNSIHKFVGFRHLVYNT